MYVPAQFSSSAFNRCFVLVWYHESMSLDKESIGRDFLPESGKLREGVRVTKQGVFVVSKEATRSRLKELAKRAHELNRESKTAA